MRWRMNPYVTVVAIISLVGFMLAGLLLMLIPRTGELVRLMQWRMSRLPRYRIESELRYASRAVADPAGEQNVSAKVMTDVDRRDLDVQLRRHVFSADVSAGPAAGIWSGTALARGADWRTRFDGAPPKVGDLDLAAYLNRWLDLGPDSLRARLAGAIVKEPSRGPSSSDRKILIALARSTPFFVLKDRLPDGMVRGLSMYRLAVDVSPVFLKEFVARSESARLGRPFTDDEKAALDRYFATLKFGPAELWIGKNDLYLYAFKAGASRTADGREETLDVVLRFSRFGEPVPFNWPSETPADAAEPLKAFFPKPETLGLAGAGTAVPREPAGSRPSGLDLSAASSSSADSDPDHDGLSNELEKFYGTDPNNPDTDGDGVNDGDEINAGTDPLGPGKLFDFGIGGKH